MRAVDGMDAVLDAKILHAMVAASAVASETWVASRIPNGSHVSAPLALLKDPLAVGNVVGGALAELKSSAVSQVKVAVRAALGLTAWPVWIALVGAFLGGLVTRAADVGQFFGFGVAGLVLAGGGAAIALSTRVAVAGAPKVSNALLAFWAFPDSVGAGAVRAYNEALGPSFGRMRQLGMSADAGVQLLASVRNVVRAVVFVSLALLVTSVVYFLVGAAEGWNGYFGGCASGVRLADGSCFVLPTG